MNHFRHIFLILLFWKEDLTKLTRILFSLKRTDSLISEEHTK